MAVSKSARDRTRPHTREVEGTPRTGAKRTVMGYISELPRFLRLLWGLITDSRVAMLDKLLVAGAIAYIVTPIDLIPDFIPFLGEVDDVYLLVLALRRLLQNAGRTVLLAHWTGRFHKPSRRRPARVADMTNVISPPLRWNRALHFQPCTIDTSCNIRSGAGVLDARASLSR